MVQRRLGGSLNFNRDWNTYKLGFGSPEHSYWIGKSYNTLFPHNSINEFLKLHFLFAKLTFLLQEMMHYISSLRKMSRCMFQLLICMEYHTSNCNLTFPLNQKRLNIDSILVEYRLVHWVSIDKFSLELFH